jgi:hypothetical protein
MKSLVLTCPAVQRSTLITRKSALAKAFCFSPLLSARHPALALLITQPLITHHSSLFF